MYSGYNEYDCSGPIVSSYSYNLSTCASSGGAYSEYCTSSGVEMMYQPSTQPTPVPSQLLQVDDMDRHDVDDDKGGLNPSSRDPSPGPASALTAKPATVPTSAPSRAPSHTSLAYFTYMHLSYKHHIHHSTGYMTSGYMTSKYHVSASSPTPQPTAPASSRQPTAMLPNEPTTTPTPEVYVTDDTVQQADDMSRPTIDDLSSGTVTPIPEPSAAPSSIPSQSLQMDDMANQYMDDTSSVEDDMSGQQQQQTEYLVEQSFVWASACQGLPDQVTVTTLGLCFSECEGCGSFKYEASSRATRAGYVEVVRFDYTDDACRVGRRRQSSEQQLLGCESGSSGGSSGGATGAHNGSIAVSLPSLQGAAYYVSR